MFKPLLHVMVFMLTGWLVFGPMAQMVSAAAISPEQYRVYDSKARYYDYDVTDIQKCSSSGAAEAGSGGPANLKVDANFSLGSDPKERRVNLMKALMTDYPGLTPEQAAGPVGNFMAESGGAHLPPDVNEGGKVGPPLFKGGYGWAQWTGGRQRFFIKFAVENGFMESAQNNATDGANYAYLKKELNESYKTTIPKLRETTSPEDAAVSFEATFEGAGIKRLDERKRNARQAFTEYGELSGGSTPTTNPGSCAVANNAALSGDTAFPLITTKRGITNSNIFRDNTTAQGGHPYTAYDIMTAPGTPVAAFMSGKVVHISSDRCPGRMISIYNEAANLTVSYLHLDFNNHVGIGAEVSLGQQIGLIGPAKNGCGVAHLHIDAARGAKRPGCSRLDCSDVNKAAFVDIGPQLYKTFQALAD